MSSSSSSSSSTQQQQTAVPPSSNTSQYIWAANATIAHGITFDEQKTPLYEGLTVQDLSFVGMIEMAEPEHYSVPPALQKTSCLRLNKSTKFLLVNEQGHAVPFESDSTKDFSEHRGALVKMIGTPHVAGQQHFYVAIKARFFEDLSEFKEQLETRLRIHAMDVDFFLYRLRTNTLRSNSSSKKTGGSGASGAITSNSAAVQTELTGVPQRIQEYMMAHRAEHDAAESLGVSAADLVQPLNLEENVIYYAMRAMADEGVIYDTDEDHYKLI